MQTQNLRKLLFAGKFLTINKKKNECNNYQSACGLASVDEFEYLIEIHVDCSKIIAKYKNIIDNIKLLVKANKSGAINPAKNQPADKSVTNEAYIPKALEDKRMFFIRLL